MLGRETIKRGNHFNTVPVGFDYLHVAIDDHSRVAFVRSLADEKGPTCARFLDDAVQFFSAHGVQIERVMTDIEDGWALRSPCGPAGRARLGVSGACPPPVMTERSARRSATPGLLFAGRAGATPGKPRPVENPVTGGEASDPC